jgi:hypothetical protein
MAGQGQMYSFSDTTTTRRTIGNLISIIDPMDVPCISYFGTKNQTKFKMLDWPNHKYAWLQDTLRVRTATLGEAMDTTETGMDVASGHGIRFKPGDVWRSDETGELIWVDSVSTDTVTVIRNWAGGMGGSQGTATSGITTATALTYQFSARLEGDDSDPSHWVTPSEVYNQSQIFHAELRVSNSEQNATTRYGIPDTYKYQLAKLMGGAGAGGGRQGRAGDLMLDLENTFFYGQRVARSSTVAGAMGGFNYFVSTNARDAASATLSQPYLEDTIQLCWAAGGKPNVIICNAFQKRLINSFYAGQVRTERSEHTGGVLINKIETDFGILDVMLSRRIPTDQVAIVEREKVGWVTLRDWFIEPLAKDGDYRKDEIIGEFGFVVENETAHARIHTLATS